MSHLKHAMLRILPSLCVAFGLGPIAILMGTFDLESIGFGFSIPLYLLPSLILYTIFAETDRFKKYAPLAYCLPAIGLLLLCIIFWLAVPRNGSDFAYLFGVVFLSISAFTFPSLRIGENWVQKLKDRGI